MSTLMSVLYWVWGVLAFFIGFMYIVGPLLVWRLQRSPASFHFVRLKDNSLLHLISPQCEAWDKELKQNDFRYIGSASMAMGSSQTYFSLYRAADGLLAALVAMKSNSRSMFYAEFTWHHVNDAITNINNLAFSPVSPASSLKQSYPYPDVHALNDLLALARKIGVYKEKENPRQPFPEGKEFEAIERFLQRESESLVQRGWYSPLVIEDYRRLTLRGAFLMTWRLLWPTRSILQRKARKEAERLRAAVSH